MKILWPRNKANKCRNMNLMIRNHSIKSQKLLTQFTVEAVEKMVKNKTTKWYYIRNASNQSNGENS